MWFGELASGLPLVAGFTSLTEMLAEDITCDAFG
jgi:hypothetical protein